MIAIDISQKMTEQSFPMHIEENKMSKLGGRLGQTHSLSELSYVDDSISKIQVGRTTL